LRVALSSAARRDRRKAESWYRRESPAAAEQFLKRLKDAIDYIAEYPLGAPLTNSGRRAKRLQDFPFSVLYRVLPDRVRVIAIVDQRRDPEFYAPR
jgi:plasmid stabilization system protein ParE